MQDHRGSNIQSRPEDALLGRTTVDVKQRRWEKILAVLCVCCLWLAYFVCSIAYSIISPFFPLEVVIVINECGISGQVAWATDH